jgi:hypothetical protein
MSDTIRPNALQSKSARPLTHVHTDEKLTAFIELERVTRESLRFQNAE